MTGVITFVMMAMGTTDYVFLVEVFFINLSFGVTVLVANDT